MNKMNKILLKRLKGSWSISIYYDDGSVWICKSMNEEHLSFEAIMSGVKRVTI
jgi:hypothetical protein